MIFNKMEMNEDMVRHVVCTCTDSIIVLNSEGMMQLDWERFQVLLDAL